MAAVPPPEETGTAVVAESMAAAPPPEEIGTEAPGDMPVIRGMRAGLRPVVEAPSMAAPLALVAPDNPLIPASRILPFLTFFNS
jgi:hypothetical protein